MKYRGLVLIAIAVLLGLGYIAYSLGSVAGAPSHIKHVVIVVQQGRSFDNLFHDFPGANTATYGVAHDQKHVILEPLPLNAGYSVANTFGDVLDSINHGQMDRFDRRQIMPLRGSFVPLELAQYPQYAYVRSEDIAPYLEFAREYVLADNMFQTSYGQRFASDLYLISGQSGHAINTPDERPWGCDAPKTARTATISDANHIVLKFPCFDFKTLGDELDQKGLTWKYYAPVVTSRRLERPSTDSTHADTVAAYGAIAHIRYGPAWRTNVVSPPEKFLGDIARGDFANVTWIISPRALSDQPGASSDEGPSWVSAIVNAVGGSSEWPQTVVIVTWADAGGWYDHVAPPNVSNDGLGERVPLLLISPYAKRYVSHTQYEYGSILRLVESIFGLAALSESDSRANNLLDCLDFSRRPTPYIRNIAKYPPRVFAAPNFVK